MSHAQTHVAQDTRAVFAAPKAMGLIYRPFGNGWCAEIKILLLRRAPHSRMFPNMWGPPAGGLEPDQDYSQNPPLREFSYPDVLLEAMVRETREETGLAIPKEHWCHLATDGFHHIDKRPAVATFFYAPCLRGEVRINHESTADGWFSLNGVRSLDERAEIIPGVFQRVEQLFRLLRLF